MAYIGYLEFVSHYMKVWPDRASVLQISLRLNEDTHCAADITKIE